MNFAEEQLELTRARSHNHWELLRKSHYCACFHCTEFFFADKVREFTDGNNTALCPFCGVDAVVPHVEEVCELSAPLIKAMNARFFGDTPPSDPLMEEF